MRFKLNDPADMQLIYEYSVKVYNKLIKQADAVSGLLARTGASEASIGMYFDIYSCMRQGEVYKRGTSEEYTKFLLASIFRDEGKPSLEKALAAVKSNAEYFEQKGRSPDRLIRACQEVVKECGVSIPFEYKRQSVSHSGVNADKTRPREISAEDMVTLKDCDRSPNKQFASTIMNFPEKYQIPSDADISIATDPDRCRCPI